MVHIVITHVVPHCVYTGDDDEMMITTNDKEEAMADDKERTVTSDGPGDNGETLFNMGLNNPEGLFKLYTSVNFIQHLPFNISQGPQAFSQSCLLMLYGNFNNRIIYCISIY